MRLTSRVGALLAGALVLSAGVGRAQERPKATVTPIVERDRIRAGSTARAALRVSLPEKYHVQSNKPRDPSLIPTVLSVAATGGVTVEEIVYPKSTEIQQLGQALDVFEREFPIGVVLKIAAGTSPGAISVPVRLRYQACDDTTCYAPLTADSNWTLQVVAPTASIGPALSSSVSQ